MKSNHPTESILLFIVGLLFSSYLVAQSSELSRKGSLGVLLQPLTPSLTETTQPPSSQGAYIKEVLANSTGQSIGLQAGDIILAMDGEKTNDVRTVVEHTKSWLAGQKLSMQIWRNGKQIQLKGKILGKPMESSPIAEVIYGSVRFRDGQLRSIVHKPKADGTFPLLVFLQGFDCSSIDYYHSPKAPIRQLINGLVEKGFAVYRVEKTWCRR